MTHGIRVRVEACYLPEHSSVSEGRWTFSYTVTITNEGNSSATLTSRHWVITDGLGAVEHVRGPGVVGYQPALAPGQSFSYTSGAILKCPSGLMQGHYTMCWPSGEYFEAEIAPFALATAESVH
ncbi:MAG: Co2+/Mg2+ efflux protein ApaG [Myxococcota bacterium]